MLTITTARINEKSKYAPYITPLPDLSKVVELKAENIREVQNFLSVRPVHTVVMSSFINDNGIESRLNRGKFYGYRNSAGNLEGVALIGHSTLVETRTKEALRALAVTARSTETAIHLVMSSGNDAEFFWKYRNVGLSQPRLKCTEVLFELSFPFAVPHSEWQTRNADMSLLQKIAEAQAEVAFIESGVDPMLADRDGFLRRVARRIEQKRVFVAMDGDNVVFKVDIIAETDDVVYLEGVYVTPGLRGHGIGSECLATLSLELLNRVEHICLLSNVAFTSAHRSFEKAGFKSTGRCTTLFV